MARYLLDTHALLWWLFDDPKLSGAARDVIRERGNDIFVSSASAWEIATKHRLGRLQAAAHLVKDIDGYVIKAGFEPLPITIRHGQHAGSWPSPHRDPFDRMLAAQSSLEALILITCDPAMGEFDVRRFW